MLNRVVIKTPFHELQRGYHTHYQICDALEDIKAFKNDLLLSKSNLLK